ncbi:hypothetical protein ACFP2T_39290 [Plantactinospora solaniradicis]|uniref:MarR family transcriptional regulator n=1 Tax=Plantactinospora solaniradicis TaxID=1723736 RepID=A0ABW1KL35_9ACTN
MVDSTLLMFPVGHYLGPTVDASGPPDLGPPPVAVRHETPLAPHRVRVAGRIRSLPGGDPYTLWLLAHGIAGGPQPWTPAQIAASAPWLTVARFDRAVADLVERRLLLVVDPDSADALAMAMAYRWNSTLHGHGMRPEWPGRYGIGGPDGPWMLVDNLVHDIWRWAPVTPTLWDACEALAPAYLNPPTDDDPTVTGPDEMLPHLLRGLHLLVCSYAGFLDEAWEDPRA